MFDFSVGAIKGFCAKGGSYPFDVVKIRMQSPGNCERAAAVANEIWKGGGISAFYQGFLPQLGKDVVKHGVAFVFIRRMPDWLKPYVDSDAKRQTITGIFIASVVTFATLPFEGMKVRSAHAGKAVFEWRWNAIGVYGAKRFIGTSAFVPLQKLGRDEMRGESNIPLSFVQSVQLGVIMAMGMSILLAPFDVANTWKQTDAFAWREFFSPHGVKRWFRGAHMNACNLIIGYVSSIYALEIADTLQSKRLK